MNFSLIRTIGPVLAAGLLAGCAGPKTTSTMPPATDENVVNIPFDPLPEDPGYYFASGVGASRKMSIARDKASADAQFQIAAAIESEFKALRQTFEEEVGTAEASNILESYRRVTEMLVEQTMRGLRMEDSEFRNEDGVYRCYALYSLPRADVLNGLKDQVNQLSKEDETYIRFRESQAMDQLDQKIKEAREGD